MMNVSTVLESVRDLGIDFIHTRSELDRFYTQVNAVQVFMMQCGFAFLEAGVVDTKNVTNILMKNFIDVIIAGVVWYLWGFGVAYGDKQNQFIGDRYFALSNMPSDRYELGYLRVSWFMQFNFLAASATILSGSIASRARFSNYMLWTVVMAGWVYPVVTHWLWSNTGWLSPFANPTDRSLPIGALDYAGGSVVHLCGGTVAIVGAWVIGPRTGRFTDEWDGDKPGTLKTFRSLWSGLGTFLLWYGWYGFNPGSSNAASDKSDVNALACINTTLGACSGAISAMLVQFIRKRNWDFVKMLNGLLAGLVSVTAGCTYYHPWAAIIIGSTAGVLYYYGTELFFNKLRIDDPVEACPVHLINGMWGMIAIGLFADQQLVYRVYRYPIHHYGAFMGGGGLLLGTQLLACVVVFSWSFLWSFVYFSIANRFGFMRVHPDLEQYGLDFDHIEMTEEQKTFMHKDLYSYNRSKTLTSKSKEASGSKREDIELQSVQQASNVLTK